MSHALKCHYSNTKITPFPKKIHTFLSTSAILFGCFDLNLDFLRPVKVRKIWPKTSGRDFDQAIKYNSEDGSRKNVTSSQELARIQCLSYVRESVVRVGKRASNYWIVGGYSNTPNQRVLRFILFHLRPQVKKRRGKWVDFVVLPVGTN